MKVCIITVYNSENCGSFWQAYALCTWFKAHGAEVSFLERSIEGTSHSKRKLLKNVAKCMIKRNLKGAERVLVTHFKFGKAIKVFKTTKEIDESFDLCVTGSDTIWQMNSVYFASHREQYWGAVSKSRKLISYAPSIANSTFEDFEKYPEISGYLERFYKVSVRDKKSLEVLRQMTEKEIVLVCDPTMLFDKKFYQKLYHKIDIRNYILIYYFGHMPEKMANEIECFAKVRKLKIVSFGEKGFKTETLNIPFEPDSFLAYFAEASYVVTNTFHGTMFSLIFEKQTLYNSDGKSKVKDVIDYLDISERDYRSGKKAGEILGDKMNYAAIHSKIEEWRKHSEEFLFSVLEGKDEP